GTTTGSVFSFTTAPAPGKITNPSPADMSTNVAIDTALSWTAGSNATSHDVYFGTSKVAVNSATPSTAGIFNGHQTPATTRPAGAGMLEPNESFFCGIGELGPGGTTKGGVISFTTASAPGQATQPSPADGDQGIALNPTLMWMAGSGANDGPTTSFDV